VTSEIQFYFDHQFKIFDRVPSIMQMAVNYKNIFIYYEINVITENDKQMKNNTI
jgi:hypothetical protein